jgi:hypothetical protein
MRPLLNGEDVSEADLNASVNIVCLRQRADGQFCDAGFLPSVNSGHQKVKEKAL